jgi:hypothetical protein
VGGDLGQGGLGFAQRRRDTRHPPHPSRGELLEVGGAIEGTIGHQRGRARGGLQLIYLGANHRITVVGITAVATARFHQDGDARLLLHHQL